jgi:hypothetical protein
MSLSVLIMTLPLHRRNAMPTDLIIYILICPLAVSFIKRVGEVFAAYETQPVDSRSKTRSR